MTSYAAIVIAFRRADLVRSVLDRLDRQESPPVLTIVVDNGGDLRAEDLGMVGGAMPRLISRPDNPGYATAVNLAAGEARRAGLGALLVLTHDAVFGESLCGSLLATLSQHDSVGAAAPTLRWVSRPEQIFSSGGVLTRGGRAYHRREPVDGGPRPVAWVDGAVVMYRLRALDAIGGLDERYFLYFEDVDTGWALHQAGWLTVVTSENAQQEPGAHPVHLGLRNMVLFVRKAGLPRTPATISVARRAGEELIVALFRERRLPLAAVWRGVRDGLAGRTGKP